MNKNFTILYVDDEQQNLISFKAAFRREYKVLTALSGQDAIEVLKENDVQLIISDQRMPEMTGVEFLENILPVYPDAIRMILTGFSDVEAIIDAINKGKVFRYITKPWDENELRMTIENAKTLFHLQVKNKSLVDQLQIKVQEQEKTLKLFMKYVPEPVVQKALSDTGDSIFEGEVRNITVLFCDIRGFTSMSEDMTPKEVVSFLNHYYSIMSDVIKRHNGVVNQFVGDEIFSVFGAPVAYPNNEENAVFCAIEMMKKLESLNELYKDKLPTAVGMGIGINSGEVVAGNLGSEDKIEYSVTGDTVNTGKRIEMLTKDTPNTILISDTVFEKTKEIVTTKEWEPVAVKGKKEKIVVYQVLNKI
ncbi:adenylate/guanylate cyclase domain-containing protein [Chondrinema litorale]|uniref:adenylate/guanylate cyclase domain-containing protein n=1 Tax=Chondrinema litorale TaxID=2994555 RepID=UPI00254345B4|nr:adenylate/guanylate cyclase domain-containing protein [Chondrinema litorale]UZR94716.1 response regulator [Chondrinema litorale]